MFLKGPSCISISRKIRKLKLEFDHEILKMLDSLRTMSSSIIECAIGSDPSDASSETVVKQSKDLQKEVSERVKRLVFPQGKIDKQYRTV